MVRYGVNITLTNEDKGYQFSDWTDWLDQNDPLLTDDGTPNMGSIYRQAQREYGRCTSSVYVDREGGPVKVGWYFISCEEYEDTHDKYLRGAWVTVIQDTDVPDMYVAH